MVRLIRILIKLFLVLLLVIILITAGLITYIYFLPESKPPVVSQSKWENEPLLYDSTLVKLGNNFIKKNEYGLYEMYIEGNAYDRGIVYGKLASDLLYNQEKAFTDEIQRMIPSRAYLKFLKYIVKFMNRDLDKHVIPEYQEEIFGISKSASKEFIWIGTNYSRQLNYHAAHDIGHALANMMLVGCTSFAAWGNKSESGNLIVGRNFDFYVGDDFAKNKIVAFYKPEKGIPFVSIIWGGFTGVVSGMNHEGVTVTINANKSSIPFGAATPVSLVAREILQYSHNISEAIDIAKKRRMFVSESFLIASSRDNKAVVIEKTPTELDVYSTDSDYILCANHYQSKILTSQSLNEIQKQESASPYRYKRLQELINQNQKLNKEQTASILRDYKGINNSDIGLTNEKSINQFIAHHSIIFKPNERKVWISTSPWQLGPYVCYDLNQVFGSMEYDRIKHVKSEIVQADSFLYKEDYKRLRKFKEIKKMGLTQNGISVSNLIQWNANYYDTYRIAGDYYVSHKILDSAKLMYARALKCEIATLPERRSIEKKLKNLTK